MSCCSVTVLPLMSVALKRGRRSPTLRSPMLLTAVFILAARAEEPLAFMMVFISRRACFTSGLAQRMKCSLSSHSDSGLAGLSCMNCAASRFSSAGEASEVFLRHSEKRSLSSVPSTFSSFRWAALPSMEISAPGFTNIGSLTKFGNTMTTVPSCVTGFEKEKRPPSTWSVSTPLMAPSGLYTRKSARFMLSSLPSILKPLPTPEQAVMIKAKTAKAAMATLTVFFCL